MAVNNTMQQIVLLRYRGSKITGLLYIATLGYMDEIVRHGKIEIVGASGYNNEREGEKVKKYNTKLYY